MQRGVLALGVGVLVVGTVVLMTGGATEPNVSVESFQPQLEANGLSLSAAGSEGVESCFTSVPPPESWRLSGRLVFERTDGAADMASVTWALAVTNGTQLQTGIVRLDRFESERVQLLSSGDLREQLEPGATVPLTLTVNGDSGTLSTVSKTVEVRNRSEPMCPNDA